MDRFKAKHEIERRIGEIMRADGFEMRGAFKGGDATFQCGNPGHGSWNFTVEVSMMVKGNAHVRVVSLYDTMRNGKLRDIETDEVVPQRSFVLPAGDLSRMGEFERELRKETRRWADKIARGREAERRGDIEEPLRALIERDPDAAAGIIAAILNERLADYEVEGLRKDVEAASMGLPTP